MNPRCSGHVKIEEHAPPGNTQPAQSFAVSEALYVTFARLTILGERKQDPHCGGLIKMPQVAARSRLPDKLQSPYSLSTSSCEMPGEELFGYGRKTFARILRFQQFIGGVQRVDRLPLSALASLCGYADQAHLSREVRRLSGLTPAAVVAQFAPFVSL